MYQIRRVDDLGRVVIPKEIRNLLHINEGAELEITCDQLYQTVTLRLHERPLNYQSMWESLRDNNPDLVERMSEVEKVYSGE